jgi:hypothetical protein
MNGKTVLDKLIEEITIMLPGDEAGAQTREIEIWHAMQIDVTIYIVADISYICLKILNFNFVLTWVCGYPDY